MYILGISESHTATAAILKDGEIIACASEERFVRKKSVTGLPRNAIQYCLKEANILSSEIDLVVFSFKNPGLFLGHFEEEKKKSLLNFVVSYGSSQMNYFINSFNIDLPEIFYKIFNFFYLFTYRFFAEKRLQKLHNAFLEKELKVNKEKFFFLDHHTAHAFAPFYMYKRNNSEKYLVITNDGYGDSVCGRVFTVSNSRWKEIASTSNSNSLGWVYAYTTKLLGFTPGEHEYKVMGLAPYAPKEGVEKAYNIIKNLIWLKDVSFESKIPRIGYFPYLRKHLVGIRFDYIAGGLQKLTENLLVGQIKNAMKKTGIKKVVVGGGVFMNVKANMEIASIPGISEYSIMPSAGDESTAIGACYYGYKKLCEERGLPFIPTSLHNLYLGPGFTEEEIKKAFISEKILHNDLYKVEKLQNPSKKIANLIADGKIVARFAGKMEFGARALGNRSILANPKDTRVIKIINDQIKGRDFWMPFAPVVLTERMHDYFVIPKAKVNNEYMMVAYKTKELAQEELIACLHQYDFTARPQVLSYEMNPSYYEIIKEFESLTGIGAILNTSFNIHGEPIVCSPADAIKTLKNSGLKYLALENYLITKR